MQYKNACCAKCNSFLGVVFNDGKPPHFLRFNINSASVNFIEKEWFPDPNIKKRELEAINKEIEEKEKPENYNIEERDSFEKDYLDIIEFNKKDK